MCKRIEQDAAFRSFIRFLRAQVALGSKFNMSKVIYHNLAACNVTANSKNIHKCGTAACIYGWMILWEQRNSTVAISDVKAIGSYLGHFAELFGLPVRVLSMVCYGHIINQMHSIITPDNLGSAWARMTEETAIKILQYLRRAHKASIAVPKIISNVQEIIFNEHFNSGKLI